MNSRTTIIGFAALLGCGLAAAWSGGAPINPTARKPKLAVSIKPQHVADALKTVIMADREVYARLYAENEASAQHGSKTNTSSPWPGPCELLRLGSQSAASKGIEYSYVLRSLNPLNPRNVPETEVESKGLQFIATRPDLTYASDELLGGRWYFTAVYPDVAVNSSCAACHNRARGGSERELKSGDVIGGLVVRIALEL